MKKLKSSFFKYLLATTTGLTSLGAIPTTALGDIIAIQINDPQLKFDNEAGFYYENNNIINRPDRREVGNIDLGGFYQRITTAPAVTLVLQNITNGNAEIDLRSDVGDNPDASHLKVNGNDLSGVDNIQLRGGSSITFNQPLTLNAPITAHGLMSGALIVDANVVLTKGIGQYQNNALASIDIKDNRQLTLKNNTNVANIILGSNSILHVDSSINNVSIQSSVGSNVNGTMHDKQGIINVAGNHQVTFKQDIGEEDLRVSNINTNNTNVIFENNVYAKKIEVNVNNITFNGKVDMFKRQAQVNAVPPAVQALSVLDISVVKNIYNYNPNHNKLNQAKYANVKNILLQNNYMVAPPVLQRTKLAIADRGELQFTGNGTISLQNDFFGDITATGNNMGKIEIDDNINFAGNVSNKLAGFYFTGNHTLISKGATFNKKLTTENDGEGKLHIEGNTEILAGIGENLRKFDEIKFLGDHTLLLSENDIHVKNIITDNNNEGTVILKGNNRIIDNTLNVGDPVAKLKDIAVADKGATLRVSNANINASRLQLLQNDQTLIVDDNISFAGHIKGNGKVRFEGRSNVNWLGENEVKLAEIKAGSQNINFNEAIYANILDCERGGNIRINNRTLNVNQVLLRDGANINFVNGLESPVTIKAESASQGTVTFSAGGKVGAIGESNKPVQSLIFVNNATHDFEGNVYTQNIMFDGGTFNVTNNLSIFVPQNAIQNQPNGLYYVAGALTSNQPQPAPTQPVQQSQNVQQPAQNQVIQQVAHAPIEEELQPEPTQYVETPHFTEDLLQNPIYDNAILQASTPIIQDHQNIEDTVLQLKNMRIEPNNELREIAGKDIHIINKTKEQKAILYALSMAPLSTKERNETNKQIKNIQQTQELAKYATETIHRTIDNRMDELGVSNLAIGVSAGDESTKKIQGVWVKGTYSSSKKVSNNGVSSYKGNSIGGTVGIDFELNDQNLLGLAYSNMKSGFKYNLIGNKINGNSHIFSLYSSHQLNYKLMLKTMFSAGVNKINTKRLAVGNIANGKIKNRSYSSETNLSYKINTDQDLFIIPNIGLRYANYKDSAYSEYGAGVHNISVKAKSNNTFSAIAGINLMMYKKPSENLLIVPSLHASMQGYLNNNNDKIKAKFAWMDGYFENSIISKKSEKISYNLGGGITMKQKNNLEISANYNCNLYNKYQNHQGAIKLKILL